MKLRLLKAAPLACAIVALLPVAAHAARPFGGTWGSTTASGGLIWYNRSVGVQGSITYTGDPKKCGNVDFTFALDDGFTKVVNATGRSTCDHRDFHFTQLGPQGGIRAVRICIYDYATPSTQNYACEDRFRSDDPAAGQDLPALPDFDTGS
jgi:hypothetical protein